MNNIKKIISDENKYYKPMIERQLYYDKKTLDNFRSETVHERRKRISKEVYKMCDEKIKYGIFKDLLLIENSWWCQSDLGSMCLGLYEKEILDFISKYKKNYFENFIDIGAADGYYGIGMLHSLYVKNSICFELTENGRNSIYSNWETNGSPGELKIFGNIFEDFNEGINSINLSKSLILIDIEGAEFDFLTEKNLKILSKSIIVIEIHNWIENFMSKYENFLKIASKYFKINILKRKERNTLTFNELRSFTDDNRLLLTSEGRPCLMRFLSLEPLREN